MEINFNPPDMEVVFDSETPWQRKCVLKTLTSMIDEDAYVQPKNNGDELVTKLPTNLFESDISRTLHVALTLPSPTAVKRLAELDERTVVKINHDYL